MSCSHEHEDFAGTVSITTSGAPQAALISGVATMAGGIGRSILVIIWHLLADSQTRFYDLGPDFYDTRIAGDRKKRNHIRQLEALGYTVTLTPAA